MLLCVDLDMTLIDTKAVILAAGDEPAVNTPEHEVWRAKATEVGALQDANAVAGILWLVRSLNCQIIFVTNRREDLRSLTEHWLQSFSLGSIPLLMRGNDDVRCSGDYKESVIKVAAQMLKEKDICVVDDDANGSVQAACLRNGWVFLKCFY